MSASLEEIIKIYQDKIWKIHRVPQKIFSNRGSQFALQFMEDLSKALRTKKNTINSILFPNRQSNRMNKSRSRDIPKTLCQLPTR